MRDSQQRSAMKTGEQTAFPSLALSKQGKAAAPGSGHRELSSGPGTSGHGTELGSALPWPSPTSLVSTSLI